MERDDVLAYGLTEAVQVSGLTRTALYNLMASGALPFVKVGRRRLVRRRDLERLLANHVDGSGAA